MLVARLMGWGSNEKLGPTNTFCANHWGLLRGAAVLTEMVCAWRPDNAPRDAMANVQAISCLENIFQI